MRRTWIGLPLRLVSTTPATISALAPQLVQALSTTSRRPVRRAERAIVSMSSGTSEIGSITSASMPMSASNSWARSDSTSMLEMPTMVIASPSVQTRALPSSTANGSSGT